MRIYKVGGCVRDKHIAEELNVPIETNDTDYVVVGATQVEFLKHHLSAKLVGKDFPVYIYKGDEYAFARKERSTGEGHRDFEVICDPTVSLLEDLARRDLTINAMAEQDGELVDPYGGLEDIRRKALKCVSEESFVEDPLRVFRVARFASQLGFDVSIETMEVMRTLAGSIESLSSERVFKELQKALTGKYPRRFFDVLYDCDCLHQFFPELHALKGVSAGSVKHDHEEDAYDHVMQALDKCQHNAGELRFAVMCHDFGKALTPREHHPKHYKHDKLGIKPVTSLCDRLKVPNSYRNAALKFTSQHMRSHKLLLMRPGKCVRLLMDIETRFPYGVAGYVQCMYSDGSSLKECKAIVEFTEAIKGVKLPEKDRNQGAISGLKLLQLRAKTYKKLRNYYLSDVPISEWFLGLRPDEEEANE